jgi:S-adenosylmethionine:tRNA ribosyltransferase-isomerase
VGVSEGAPGRARPFADLAEVLVPGDLVVVNDAATFPASLHVRDRAGRALELRLLSLPDANGDANAVLFGAGDWRTKTEDRPPPPPVSPGDVLVGDALVGTVRALLDHPRLASVRFAGERAGVLAALYRAGRPIQYSYLKEPLALWDVQNVYGGSPVAAELPSAGYAITFALLERLAQRGVRVVALTHAAGLSASGDAALDARLPLPERYAVPAATLEAVRATRARGGRVIAIGTSVVRALETVAMPGAPLEGITTLRIDGAHRLALVDAIVTGVHAPGESHYDLLEAFVGRAELDRAFARADALGLLTHEFGDAMLLERAA